MVVQTGAIDQQAVTGHYISESKQWFRTSLFMHKHEDDDQIICIIARFI